MVQAFQNQHQIQRLKTIFMAIDTDFSGSIQKSELQTLFQSHGFELTDTQYDEIFECLFIKEAQYITFIEFEAAILGKEFFHDEERLRTIFTYLDLDRNGSIESEEISDCFKRFGRNLR